MYICVCVYGKEKLPTKAMRGREMQETNKGMHLVPIKFVLKLRKNTNCMTSDFKRNPNEPTSHVYIKPKFKPCKITKNLPTWLSLNVLSLHFFA